MTKRTISHYTNSRENNYDIIRFIAASLVIYQHSFPLGQGGGKDIIAKATNSQWNAGALGVAIFFIVSGFLVTQSYLRSNNIFTFAKARVVRIYPGLLAAVILSVFILGPLVTTLSIKDYFLNTMTYDYLKVVKLFPMQWHLPGVFDNNVYKSSVNGSLWTIPFEVLCYFVVGFIGFIGLLRYKTPVLALWIFSMFCLFYYKELWPSGYVIFGLQFDTFLRLFTYFSSGMVLFLFKDYIQMNKWFALFSIIMLCLSSYYGGIENYFIIFGSYLVIFFAYTPIWNLSKFSKYGDFSYGLYIYAFPIQQLVTYIYGGKTTSYLNFCVSFGLTLLISIFSWNFIEKPSLKLKSVLLIIRFIPISYLNFINKIYKKFIELIDFLITGVKGWQLTALLIIFLVLFSGYTSTSAIIEFPYPKDSSIFLSGWHPQEATENYRWIEKSAVVKLKKPKDAEKFIIEGFIPETFNEVNQVRLYLNDEKVTEQTVKSGEPFQLIGSIPHNLLSFDVKIDFNDIHKPTEDAADQRRLSALINKIELK